jgi:hypothetical protein
MNDISYSTLDVISSRNPMLVKKILGKVIEMVEYKKKTIKISPNPKGSAKNRQAVQPHPKHL